MNTTHSRHEDRPTPAEQQALRDRLDALREQARQAAEDEADTARWEADGGA